MNLRLRGSVVVVTGATGGIGRSICELLAWEGAHVVASDIEPPPPDLEAELDRYGGAFMRHDVTDAESWCNLLGETESRLGSVNGIVNNAGIVRMRSLESMTLDAWREEMAVNLDGVFLGTQAGIRSMRKHGGAIVNISSVAAMVGIHTAPAYCASKGGVRAFTKAAAMYCAHRRYDIRINSMHPGYIDTPMVDELLQQSRDPEAMHKVLAGQPAMGRFGTPNDVARGVLYLCGESGRYITGTELVIDGGYLAH